MKSGKIGYKHPKCYANSDGFCSTKISKEHFISETLLRQLALNSTVKISGLARQHPEKFDLISLGRLGPRILCTTHNPILTILDATMGKFSEAIRDFDSQLKNPKSAASEQRDFLGSDIERWMLKYLLGYVTSENPKLKLKPECIDLLFKRIDWPDGWGLYFSIESPVYHSHSFLFETLIDSKENLVMGAKIVIRGMRFFLLLGKPDNPKIFGIHRPKALAFKSSDCEKNIVFDWDKGEQNDAIFLERTGSYDGPPPDWKQWEKEG